MMDDISNDAPEDAPDAANLSRRNALGVLGAAGALTGVAATSAHAAAKAPQRFKGRVAVITGGARGMGRSHAVMLAQQGARIVVCDSLTDVATLDYPLATQADMAETEKQVRAAGGQFLGIKADVRDPAAANDVIAQAQNHFGRVDLLIANAGIVSYTPLASMSDQMFDDVMRTNVYGVFHSVRAALAPMTKQSYGRIVVIASQAGRMGLKTGSHYSASKWAVIGMTKSLALEVAKQNITVNCVCPTVVNTPLYNNPAAWKRALPNDPAPTREKFEAQQAIAPYSPQGIPWVQPEDISKAALFLLSDDADHITGAALDVTAGGSAMINA
jgi:SDR family mycofactocin-dependent oxidoreductase